MHERMSNIRLDRKLEPNRCLLSSISQSLKSNELSANDGDEANESPTDEPVQDGVRHNRGIAFEKKASGRSWKTR